ncbi:hypothetical protein SDC9_145302 [bioreactor metagenome]|uniref:Uncharacterized protein n=1 Tax=bioreactor metagenome TaxID=1076179 RepID=A0A645E9L6_9ZZZZ
MEDAGRAVDQHLGGMVGIAGHLFQRLQVTLQRAAVVVPRDPQHLDPGDLLAGADHRVRQDAGRDLQHEVVDAVAVTTLHDLDRLDVAADEADGRGDGTQGAGSVGHGHSHQEHTSIVPCPPLARATPSVSRGTLPFTGKPATHGQHRRGDTVNAVLVTRSVPLLVTWSTPSCATSPSGDTSTTPRWALPVAVGVVSVVGSRMKDAAGPSGHRTGHDVSRT